MCPYFPLGVYDLLNFFLYFSVFCFFFIWNEALGLFIYNLSNRISSKIKFEFLDFWVLNSSSENSFKPNVKKPSELTESDNSSVLSIVSWVFFGFAFGFAFAKSITTGGVDIHQSTPIFYWKSWNLLLYILFHSY